MLLYDRHIASLGSFGAVCHIKLDNLRLFELLEAASVDGGVMNEDIRGIWSGDETESLLFIEPLDSTLTTHSDAINSI